MSKVLIAEDDKFLLMAYAAKMKKAGFDAVLANNGAEAVQKAVSENPDIILLDLVMPEKDGFEALADLKKDAKTKKIPVIILSNLGQEEDIEKGKKLGAADYLIKSDISIKGVVEKINSILKK